MADGVGAVATGAPTHEGLFQSLVQGVRWLSRTKYGLLTLWIGIAFLGYAAGAYYYYQTSLPMTLETVAYAIAVSTLAVLPVLLLLTDPEATLAQGPRLRLPVATSLLLVGLTVFAVIDHRSAQWLTNPAVRLAFFALLALALVPRVWNAIEYWRFKAEQQRAADDAAKINQLADAVANRTDDVERKIKEYRTAESASAFIVTLVVGLIIGAAYYIGNFPSDPSLGAGLGVGIFVVVISLFAIVLAVDWLADLPAVRQAGAWGRILAKPGAHFAAFYDGVDATLVFVAGHVAGADHLKAPSRYLILGVTLLCLAIMGWQLPPPFGLAPVLIGLVLGLAVSRLWSWVEEDRNLAAITQFSPKAPQRIGFREDFRDETLLGFIFVLALIPIGMMQVHESNLLGGPLFVNVADPESPIATDNFLVWLGYFGFELAKALPIVDWADIYHLGPGGDSITPTRPRGMHAVFAARALVDLLLIAALLQALGIASRNRQQKYLYAERHIDRLDALVEKAELNKAIRATLLPSEADAPPKYDFRVLTDSSLTDFRQYNEARLREIFLKSSRADVRAFISELFAQRGTKPAPAMVTVQDIAASHRSELDLMRTFDEAKREHSANIYPIPHEDIATVLFQLRESSGMREFKFELIDFAAKLPPKKDALAVLTTVAVGAGRDGFLYTRKRAAQTIVRLVPEIDDREALQNALAEFEARGPEVFGAYPHDWSAAVSALRDRLARLL
jgi:hypothetical protein